MHNEALIIADYQSGLSTYKVAEKHNCNPQLVHKILKRNNVQTRTKKEASAIRFGHEEALDDDKIVADYLSGLSMPEVAKKHNCNHNTVKLILARNYVKSRSNKEASAIRFKRQSIIDTQQVILDHQNGMTRNQIAAKHNCNRTTILRILRST